MSRSAAESSCASPCGTPSIEGGNWCVYLLSCADGSLYCGVTKDMERRLAMHNGLIPGGARYTRGRRPVSLEACAGGFSQGEALRLEARIKKMKRLQKRAALENCARQCKV